jgi:hypothetical protein
VKSFLISPVTIVALASAAFGYGPTGHEIVGGIADKLLTNTAAGARVYSIIEGISLEKAAVMPDEIKAWDQEGIDNARAFPHYFEHRKIDSQLREFWRANQPTHDPNSPMPSHHWFHYTDVPVLNEQKYSGGQTGRSQWDVVHMIAYCVDVLRGQVPENNARKITRPIAVILLAHYVGDIHQPLHVGAEYFDGARPVDPDKGQAGIEDEGGNTILLQLNHGTPGEMAKRGLKLHGFWDNEAVMANLPAMPLTLSKEERYQAIEKAKRQLIDQFAHEQPAGWRLPANLALKNYGQAWADEILPVAREAHERLRFVGMHSQLEEDRTVAAGRAQEKNAPDRVAYADWAAKIVREELHKAGWRLADLLSQALTSTSVSAAAVPIAPKPIPAAPVIAAPATVPSASASPTSPAPAAPTSLFGEYPTNYKEIIVAWMKANGLDSSKIDWQSEPKPADIPGPIGGHLSGYLVIFNTPEHATSKTRSILIHDGAVIHNSGF